MSQIFIYDDLHPEDNAMLQALYSRSPNSVQKHLGKVYGADSGTFMEKYYVGYGHSSIADCGSTTIFIENVSMLVAKAVQDWPLYSGQEASTRYLDYSKQEVLNPISSKEGFEIQKRWMNFYESGTQKLSVFLKEKYPISEGQKESVYDKAIAAKSFDIMRSFLPAGCTTYLSWHTNLRQAHEQLIFLLNHPLNEVRTFATEARKKLKEKYKNSFSQVLREEQEIYYKSYQDNFCYNDPQDFPDFLMTDNIEKSKVEELANFFSGRPQKTGIPFKFGNLGQIRFQFKLDFGSFRDIQRHRNGECIMPLLSTGFGFEEWYLSQLPDDFREQALKLFEEQSLAINSLTTDKYLKQYYIPMGYIVPVDVTYRLPAAVYVAELRSGKTVHPTLRKRAQQMGEAISKKFPEIKMHCDYEKSDWDISRGTQDITKK